MSFLLTLSTFQVIKFSTSLVLFDCYKNRFFSSEDPSVILSPKNLSLISNTLLAIPDIICSLLEVSCYTILATCSLLSSRQSVRIYAHWLSVSLKVYRKFLFQNRQSMTNLENQSCFSQGHQENSYRTVLLGVSLKQFRYMSLCNPSSNYKDLYSQDALDIALLVFLGRLKNPKGVSDSGVVLGLVLLTNSVCSYLFLENGLLNYTAGSLAYLSLVVFSIGVTGFHLVTLLISI